MLAGEKIGKLERVTFGLFEADLHSGELWKAGFRIKLPRQPFRVLTALLGRPGEIVTREELQQEIWGDNTNVDFDQAIAAAINKIREALGDSAENPRFIQTLTKRGYRFIAPVTPVRRAAGHVGDTAHVREENSHQPSGEDETKKTANAGDLAAEGAAKSNSPAASLGAASAPLSPSVIHSSKEPRDLVPSIIAEAPKPRVRTAAAILVLSLCALCLAAGSVLDRLLLPPASSKAPSRIDQVSHYVPISLGPPNPESFLTMAIDGDRVLTSVMVNGLPRLSSIDVDTGAVQGIAVPDEISSNSLSDISKDGSRLLLRSQQSTESEQPLWVVPSVGGSGRRLPGVLAHDAAWMPDGQSILYASGDGLFVKKANEDAPTLYVKLPGRAFWLRWSPDGKLLRFTLFNPVTHATALWEVEGGNQTARPVQLPHPSQSSACCGVWLPDGHSYIYQAEDNLWQLKGFARSAQLIQLTNGPLRCLSPVPARSGNRIFFIGLESPSGLQEFDPDRKEFHPAPAFLADANRIEYSRDGKWVAWTDIHEKLWRAHIDGSDKVRLTSDALEVFLAHWSPDGRSLAVMARKPEGVWQIYLVDASGDKAEALLNETRNAADPGWSADGNSLVFGREPDLMGKESGSHTLGILSLSTHQATDLPNSEGLFSPRWSPDGRWIVALSLNQKDVMLYDTERARWQLLASTSAADPVWSTDSKAIYIHAFLASREPILRIEVPSGTTRTIADLSSFHDGGAANYFFSGTTFRGEPLVQPRVGTGNLYSLDLRAP